MTDHYLWVDLETTGLDPNRCGILEIAAVLTTTDMKVIDEFESFVLYEESFEREAWEMHNKNGLIAEYEAMNKGHGRAPYREHVEKQLIWLFRGNNVTNPMLAGASVHFDRAFIRHHMRLLDEHLHYRHLDVSAITEMMRGLGYELPDMPASEHRAMSDIRRTMATYRYWREVVGRSGR